MQMLRKDLQADEISQRLMDIAVRETTRLDSIITEFLQYARPPALNLAEFDLNKVLAETLDLVQHEAQTRTNIKIVISLAGGPLTIHFEPHVGGHIQHALIFLLTGMPIEHFPPGTLLYLLKTVARRLLRRGVE